MTDIDIRLCCDSDTRRKYAADGPIDFGSWLALSERIDTELVRGVMIDRMAAQYPHEWIFMWLSSVLSPFVMHRKLGVVLGSRTAVKISGNDGRLPDLLFVRADNTGIIHKDAIYGVPDLVIEIVSENDGPAILIPLEADYRAIGVPEIVFIDPKKKRVRFLKKRENQNGNDTGEAPRYDDAFLTTGRLEFSCVPDFWIEIDWLFAESKPDEYNLTKQLIEAAEASTR